MSVITDAVNSIRKRLISPIKPKAISKSSEEFHLVATKPKGASEGRFYAHLEERVVKTVPLGKLEKLYHLDFLTFRIVNDYVDGMIGPGFFLEGNKKTVALLMKWAEKVKLKRIMEEIVRDVFLSGNPWVELGYNEVGNDILKLQTINPKFMDYIRDDKTGYVMIDKKTGEFVGYKRSGGFDWQQVEWKRDKIVVGDKVVQRFTTNGNGKDRIAHFKLYGLGESYLGTTPLEPCYRQAIIRLNISRNVGEGAYRSEGLIITVGDENVTPTNDQVDKVSESFEDIETDTIFAFKFSPKVAVDRLPSPDLTGRESLLYYFADAFATGMGKPLCLLMESLGKGRTTDVEAKGIQFEHTIKALQERLAEQIRDKIFYRYMDAKKISKDKLEKVVFKTNMPTIKLAKARRIAILARNELIRYDPELEKHLRMLEDIPTSMLDEAIKKWKEDGTLPEERTEKDIKERLSELEEEIEELKKS